MTDTHTYVLDEQEIIIFKPEKNAILLYSQYENGSMTHVGTYSTGRWLFTDYSQRQQFFSLYANYRKQLHRAFRLYFKKKDVSSKYYQLTCLKRRFTLQIIKLTRKVKNNF